MGSATIRVQFGNPDGTGAEGHLSAEVDTREDGLNEGRQSFEPGASVAILVYRSDNVTVSRVDCSAGSIRAGGQTTVSLEEDVTFGDESEATLRVPALTAPGVRWFGRSLGALVLQADRMTLRAAEKGVAVARVTYQARADVYRLKSPASIDGETDFSIVVFIGGVSA
ncbi:MAG: hypothetical protein H3C26_07345 [Rhodocyclaceae bacterium]|nr:hypothetical protein [Rhodocyclaceae bacterium]